MYGSGRARQLVFLALERRFVVHPLIVASRERRLGGAPVAGGRDRSAGQQGIDRGGPAEARNPTAPHRSGTGHVKPG